MYSYGQIALAIARAIIGHTRTSKSTDYCSNCTLKCVINYTNNYKFVGHSGALRHGWTIKSDNVE